MTQSYNGQVIEIPVGVDGLHGDDPNSKLSPGSLIISKNISYQNGAMEKAPGSMRWNTVALPSSIVAALDWFPDDTSQRLIAMGADGRIYRMANQSSFSEILPSGGAPSTLNPFQYANFITGGQEDTANPRKIFALTGYDPVQVISGDAGIRTTIALAPSDFSGTTQPLGGTVFRGMLFLYLRNGSTVFASLATNHEDFTTQPLPYSVYPGEGQYISDIFVFQTKLFVAKYPRGLFVLNDSDSNPQNWYFQKLTGSFGASAFRSAVQAFGDTYVANEYGGVTSLTATNATGDVKSSDVFAMLRMQRFIKNFLNQDGRGVRQGIYYNDRQQAMWVYRGKTSVKNDYIVVIDFSNQQMPKITFYDKDQPNCLFLRKDINGIERPAYGSSDGFIYIMDSANYWVGSADTVTQNPYKAQFQIPHIDLSSINPVFGDSNKQWEFLEVFYEPQGKWDLNVDVFIDGRFHKTLSFDMASGSHSGHSSDLDNFALDQCQTSPETELRRRLPIQGNGNTISFSASNAGIGQNFKVTKFRIYFKLGGQQERK